MVKKLSIFILIGLLFASSILSFESMRTNQANSSLQPFVDLTNFDREKETFVRYIHDPGNARSLGDDTLWSIYGDRSAFSGLAADWAGSINLIDRMRPLCAINMTPVATGA